MGAVALNAGLGPQVGPGSSVAAGMGVERPFRGPRGGAKMETHLEQRWAEGALVLQEGLCVPASPVSLPAQ